MNVTLRPATRADMDEITRLIGASVRSLQPEYTAAQREAALATVFTVDTRLIADGTYLLASCEDRIVGCGGWSFRKTLYGGDHQVEDADAGTLDPTVDAAKIRAIFVHPDFARQGLGGLLLSAAEDLAADAGFTRFQMGSTLAGLGLYSRRGYHETERVSVPVGGNEAIVVVKMTKHLGPYAVATRSGR